MRVTRSLSALAAAASAVAVLSACGGSADDNAAAEATATPGSDAATSEAPSTEPTETAEPTEEPSTPGDPATEPTEPTEPTGEAATTQPTKDAGDPSDSTAKRAGAAQIPAAALPGFNPEWAWARLRSGPGPARHVPSVCMRASLTAIGAVNEYRTDYRSRLSETAEAVQMTAVFPDEKTAVRATGVLRQWHDECARHATKDLLLKHVEVSDVSAPSTAVGRGLQWLTTYRPVAGDRDATWFHAEGFVRDGDTLTYVGLKSSGQDYNYKVGAEPIDLALRVAGDYLARTR